MTDLFGARDILKAGSKSYAFYRLDALEKSGLTDLKRMPFSMRIVLESALRQCDERTITKQDVKHIAAWSPKPKRERPGMPFLPGRVVMQDFTGVPAVVDLAAMRAAMARLGGDPKKINPLVPVDLVIDHSIQVDFFATADALQRNTEMEFQRNRERYEFLKWGQKAFSNFRVVPPMTGIVHQVNLEYLSQVVTAKLEDSELVAFPDTLVGTDSHTTMVNGLGVLGWGVGGIEAEAVMLGQPLDMLLPDVVGFRLHGQLQEGVTATDVVLTVTQMLRKKRVVDKFVEFYGRGLDAMTVADRATIANMAPEYGATCGYFPVDEQTLRYLRLSGRPADLVDRVEAYCHAQGLFRDGSTPDPEFSDTIELDLGSVVPSLAGPKRPQDRVPVSGMKEAFQFSLVAPTGEQGCGLDPSALDVTATVGTNGGSIKVKHGVLVIAAITSCTNTSNPSVMVAAGLLAKKAREKGLTVPPYVKTSLAPGSRVVTEYLKKAELLEPLSELGFNVVAYGCTTCIGNSGPLPAEVAKAIASKDLVAAAVLSGNRNFEGRINPLVKASYLASPPLVVAFALAGRVDINLDKEPLASGSDGQPVYLRDLWPSQEEIAEAVSRNVASSQFQDRYGVVFEGSDLWKGIQVPGTDLYEWDPLSTYIHHPPFFQTLGKSAPTIGELKGARVLCMFGDSISTDHISPAGNIAADSPAGKYLQERGIKPKDFNSYGSRRGNDLVMERGTFANIRLHNLMVAPREGPWTRHFGKEVEETTIFDAAQMYKQEAVPTIVLAGKDYGQGSSRDWAAKGPGMLGVRAVLAVSFERIHRSNLVGMGVLPLKFEDGQSAATLGLDGSEVFDIEGLTDDIKPLSTLTVRARRGRSKPTELKVTALLNTPTEVVYYRNGGILHTVLREMLK